MLSLMMYGLTFVEDRSKYPRMPGNEETDEPPPRSWCTMKQSFLPWTLCPATVSSLLFEAKFAKLLAHTIEYADYSTGVLRCREM